MTDLDSSALNVLISFCLHPSSVCSNIPFSHHFLITTPWSALVLVFESATILVLFDLLLKTLTFHIVIYYIIIQTRTIEMCHGWQTGSNALLPSVNLYIRRQAIPSRWDCQVGKVCVFHATYGTSWIQTTSTSNLYKRYATSRTIHLFMSIYIYINGVINILVLTSQAMSHIDR